MPEVEYRCRTSRAGRGEVLWRALGDKLEFAGADGAVHKAVPYKKIHRIRLAVVPGKGRAKRFLMELNGASTRRLVPGITFETSERIDETASDFFPLVRQVVAGVKAANPRAEVREGEHPTLYWLMFAFNLLLFAGLTSLVFALPVLPDNPELSAILKSVLIVFSAAVMLTWAIESRPRTVRRWRDIDRLLSARTD